MQMVPAAAPPLPLPGRSNSTSSQSCFCSTVGLSLSHDPKTRVFWVSSDSTLFNSWAEFFGLCPIQQRGAAELGKQRFARQPAAEYGLWVGFAI